MYTPYGQSHGLQLFDFQYEYEGKPHIVSVWARSAAAAKAHLIGAASADPYPFDLARRKSLAAPSEKPRSLKSEIGLSEVAGT